MNLPMWNVLIVRLENFNRNPTVDHVCHVPVEQPRVRLNATVVNSENLVAKTIPLARGQTSLTARIAPVVGTQVLATNGDANQQI